MNTFISFGFLLLVSTLAAQTAVDRVEADSKDGPAAPQILSRAAHERTWVTVNETTNLLGEKLIVTNTAFVEIGGGLCYRDRSSGEWRDSKAVIQSVPGGAMADQSQHVVFWPNNLADGPVEVEMDGKRVAFSPRFLVYGDGSSEGVLLAEFSGTGTIAGDNQVIYRDVCANDKLPGVNIRFTLGLNSLEQDILFTEALPPDLPEVTVLTTRS